eukprot:m.21850 g.21850  ORF g.21850 m.21850 type:complete len:186 (-) comp8767_c0_seq1:313-870(-)
MSNTMKKKTPYGFGSSSSRDKPIASRLGQSNNLITGDPMKYKNATIHETGYHCKTKPASKKGFLPQDKRKTLDSMTSKFQKEHAASHKFMNSAIKSDEEEWKKKSPNRATDSFGCRTGRWDPKKEDIKPSVGVYDVNTSHTLLSTSNKPTSHSKTNPSFSSTSPRPVLTTTKTKPSPCPGAYNVM